MKYLHRWVQFAKERFNPLSYASMILVFISAHYVLFMNLIEQTENPFLNVLNLIPIVLATTLFFFRLRLFDEVKDMESDAVHHPERPLPRGMLSKNEVIRFAFVFMVVEVILFSYYGLWAFGGALVVSIYSLIMYKEFFIKKWLRAHLTTYAITHTFVVVLMSLTIFTALFSESIIKIPGVLIYFSFAGWFLFNIFEFGRKTFASQEEKEGIKSYSKIFGRIGAVLLVLAMVILSIIFIKKTLTFTTNFLILWSIPLIFIALLYVWLDKPFIAKIYRGAASLYIIFIYGTITASWFFI